MPNCKINEQSPLGEICIDDSVEFVFGPYLRAVRTARGLKIRQLAKTVGKTPTYLSDIENRNNKPPEKGLLDKIISALNLEQCPKIRTNLYDLAARERNDVPADIKEYIMGNQLLLDLIRNTKDMPNGDQVWLQIFSML